MSFCQLFKVTFDKSTIDFSVKMMDSRKKFKGDPKLSEPWEFDDEIVAYVWSTNADTAKLKGMNSINDYLRRSHK